MKDWSRAALGHPALASVRPWSARLERHEDWPSVEALDAALRDRLAIDPEVALERQIAKGRRRGAPVDRSALYAVRIHDARRIPTRERSWHDLLNALVWAAFPESKRALTARQRAIVEVRVPPGTRRLPAARSREEDALAMLDEGGIVIVTRDAHAVSAAHRDGDVEAIRAAIDADRAAAHVLGHALMEHAIAGDPTVRGFAVVVAADDLGLDAADRALAAWIGRGDELAVPESWRALALDAVLGS